MQQRLPHVVLMPRVEPRHEWEHLKKAEARQREPLGPPYVFCKSCTVGIGVTYVARELYLLPVVKVRKRRPTLLTFQPICGICARDEYALHYGFCVLDESDWEQLDNDQLHQHEQHKTQLLHQFLVTNWPLEGQQLQDSLRQLAPALAPDLSTLSPALRLSA